MPDKPKKDKVDKVPKIRAQSYEKPLKIHGTFDQAMGALVKEPRAKYTVQFPDKGKKD